VQRTGRQEGDEETCNEEASGLLRRLSARRLKGHRTHRQGQRRRQPCALSCVALLCTGLRCRSTASGSTSTAVIHVCRHVCSTDASCDGIISIIERAGA
jgi:hypothetical protein